MKFKSNLNIDENTIYVECFNDDKIEKKLTLFIYDVSSNIKLTEYKFNFIEYIKVFSSLAYNIKDYPFLDGYVIKIINNENEKIEYDNVILINSYIENKFFNDELSHETLWALNNNLIETFKNDNNDILDLKNCNIIVDLGSSIGIFTSYVIKKNPNVRSICVEMNPKFYNICNKTFEWNKNITCINAAIYKNSKETIVMKSERSDFCSLGSTISDDVYGDKIYSAEVKTISLQDIVKEFNINKIDFLKVDIEGYEYELFENIDDEFILNKIGNIFLEFHKTNDKINKINLIYRLMNIGYSIDTLNKSINFNDNMFTLLFKK